jgi:uncharacterized protein
MVKCRIAPSIIHGLGLFAVEYISAGTIIWQFDSRIDTVYSLEDYLDLREDQRMALRHYAYVSDDKSFILCGDHAVFMNHQDNPNTIESYNTSDYGEDIAIRDIQIGDELTTNYKLWDHDVDWKLSKAA